MEPCGNKGTFVGFSETSKEFKIYVLGERHVEVSRYVTFLEEEAFKLSKELKCGLETEVVEDPISKDHDDDSSPYDVQRENPAEHTDLHVIDESIKLHLLQREDWHGVEMY